MALWTLHNDGVLEPGAVVAPHERLSWGKTIGLGAQHVVAMFGATFVFPILMGLNPQLAVMMSGVATLLFLAIVRGRVPSYLGSSASFVGVATAIYAAGGKPAHVSGAMLWCGVALAAVGVVIHLVGAGAIHRTLPPVVTGAVVMLIGFNLAPVVARTYWPQDQWVALAVMLVVVVLNVGVRGFLSRVAIFLSLVIGYLLSWLLDLTTGPITSFQPGAVTAQNPTGIVEHLRVDWSAVAAAPWFGFPPRTEGTVVGWHLPEFSWHYAVLALPIVIALIAENTGHVKAVAEMTGTPLDREMGKAIAADGLGSILATGVGAGPTTTYAENIGVMAATRVYSTAAYVVAALVAILFGFSPKFGAIISATPGGVLGGICVVLYGMIGLLGAKIWKENGVDFGNPVNLVPVAAGIIIGIGDTSLRLSDGFTLGGIALGTLVTVLVYHLAHAVAPQHLRDTAGGTNLVLDTPGMYVDEDYREDDPRHRAGSGTRG
ncbi:uracil-xanthine permease family protein [Arsenicicoccus sp. oral taxon 190]|uniref:uracil-xanthine permease family protein n=1 Tax=Arsenicicoccus sp. oral taxon 190 TaxID=1658671 RepID=UPI000679FB1E|nr:solute carrier family 23 protein [Arsenicicoccus sp. oral taxon 190]AKT51732.1 nitrate reductase [Arsenicicoccus sp. oral taxon 190]